jgi:hypothetical protein
VSDIERVLHNIETISRNARAALEAINRGLASLLLHIDAIETRLLALESGVGHLEQWLDHVATHLSGLRPAWPRRC